MSSSIKTAIRVRPLLKYQIEQGYQNTKIKFNQDRSEVTLTDSSSLKNFRCDYLVPPETSQDQLFSQCKLSELVEKVLQGYNSTVFAYGQTGSGKSFTIHGGEEGEGGGIAGRLVKLLFKRIAEHKGQTKYTVSVSFLQIYSEKIYDLLNAASLNNRSLSITQTIEGLRLRWNKDDQFTVENLFVFECKDEAQLLKYINAGLKNRISAAHKLNLQSSRSHSILSVKVEGSEGSSIRRSRIDIVDLAGSERIGLTKAEGRLAKQSIEINKSLFTLRQVINVLSENHGKKKDERSYVPYRDSKLTSILKQSIGGNSYCLMIACLTPNDAFLQENLSTLTYTTRASFITNTPVLNVDQNTKLIIQLRSQLSQVNSELQKANKHIEFLSQLKDKASTQEQQPSLTKNYLSPARKAKEQGQNQLPSPQFSRRISEALKADYNSNISQRLIESINMVRELLKSNKQLRQKLEQAENIIDDRNTEINQLIHENQVLREHSTHPHPEKLILEDKSSSKDISQYRYGQKLSSQMQSRRHSLKIPGPISRPPTHDYKLTQSTSKRNSIPEKVLELGNLYLNQKGIDSAPTNFNKRLTSTAQQQRTSFQRGSSQQMDRHAITAKFSKRGWLLKEDPKCFFSFYQGSREDKNL